MPVLRVTAQSEGEVTFTYFVDATNDYAPTAVTLPTESVPGLISALGAVHEWVQQLHYGVTNEPR